MGYDRIDSMYDALVSDGAQIGTRQQFKKLMLAPGKEGYKNRLGFYQAMKQDGANIGATYEDFGRALGLHAVKPQHKAMPLAQKPVQPVKKQTMKQRAQEVAAQYQKSRQQKAQQPRTATTSGTDYMQNWRLMHMRNDQMNPMQQAQASNARARMQRAQEQSARQEQQRATPISRSRITPTAKNFNETMQQFSTPEARQARAKQQREDDARNLAQYEVEGNNFVMNDGKYGTIAPEIDSLVAPSMKEADDLSWSQYQQDLQKAGNDAYLRNKAWKDLQDNRIKNRQNVLADTLSSKLQEIYSQKGLQEHIMQSADKLNMGVEEYVDKYVTPQMMQRAQNILGVKNIEEILPQSATEYVVRRLSDSILGTLSAGQDKSREQIAREQEAMAISDGLEEMPTVKGYKANEGYKSGVGARFVSTAANMAMDSPILEMTGSASNLTVDLGKQILMKGLAKAGLVKAGAKLTAQQLAFKAANMTMAQKIASGLVEGTAKSALNLGGYSSITAALGQASTGDDTSLSALGQAALEGFEHGATTGAMFGVSGAIMAPWVSKFGITGLEKSTSEKWLHGTQKLGATAAGLGVEAGTMMVADNITGDKDISFGTWLEDVVMVGAFKAGEPKNYAHIGNALYNLAHNVNPHFVIGKNANGSPIAVDIRLTPDEKNELISSASGKNLMDAFTKVDRASKTAPRDPKYKTAYTDFMNDPDVSQSTKEKVNAAMGLFNTTRGRSYRSVNDVKNKQILEYTKNGTLLTRTSYKNADERRAILYKQKLYRDNDDMMSLIGYSKMKDMQLTDEDGNVTSLALGFLRNKGYDTSKDVTDPENAQLINDLRNPKSALYLDWENYVDVYGSYGDLKVESADVVDGLIDTWKKMINDKGNITVDIDNIMRKDPMKRTDQENKIFYYVKSELENRLFPSGKPHADQSASQGKTVAEENKLGTDNPEGGVVVDELRNLHNAEQAVDEAMESNDVFKQTFEKLHQQGLTPAQIYDALIQNGLTEEELTPLAQYINANARVQGMQQATADAIEENVKSFVSDWSYHGTLNGQAMNGEQALYVQDSNGRTLLVGSGDVAFDQTTGRAKEGSGDMLVCFDPNTKEMVYVKADEVTFFQNQPIDQFAAEYRQRLQIKNSEPYNQAAQEQAMQDAAKAQQEVQPKENKNEEISNNETDGKIRKGDNANSGSDGEAEENASEGDASVQQVEQPQPTRKFADGTDVPMATDSKGRPTPDYEKMTPEQSAEILTEDFGDNAEKVVDGQIQKAEKALKDAEKMKVDYTAEPNDIMEQEALKNQTIEAAKKQLDHAQNIKKAMTAKKVAETVGSTEQAEGAHEAGSVAAQKFVNAPRLVGNKRTRMLADGETKIKGHYEIVPAESLTPSHDVNNGYKKSEGFPTDAEGRTVNDRDYEHDKAAQQNTDQIARKYNGMAIENVPVVSDEGIVYDGNGRTMAGQKAAKDGTDGEYINDLLENAENFGFTREQIEQSGIEHPRLVMVTDERLPYDAATFAKFNRNEKKTQSNTEQAVAKAKTLTSDEVGAIVAEIEGNGSLDAFFNNSKAINDLVKTLVDKGIIGQNEVAQMMDSPERLSAQGREYVKNLLLGSIFKPETIRMLGIDSTVKNKAINAIRSVMDNMKLGDYSLRDEIDQAIQLLYEARQGGNKVDTLLRTPDMFGEDAAKRYSSISQMMALALEGKVSDFRDLLDEYNRIAKARNTGEGNMFEAAPTKEELINEYLNFKKWQDYGTGHSENEGGNDVSGVEEPQQEASGGNEPAEAERPRVEEADDLENKELESRIEVTDEETETPSKNGPIMKQKILIDGDKEVIKVDEPNDKGEYTGSYYEYDSKKFGDLNEVVEYIDEANADKLTDVESDWQNKIDDYIAEHYPHHNGVRSRTPEEQAAYDTETEAMKKDPVLAQMRKDAENAYKEAEGPLPLLPKEENPDPTFDPIAAAAAEFKKEHPLTEDEIMKADVDDLSKDMALDYLNGEVTDDLHRAIYESIFAKTRGQKTEPKVETPKAEPSADPMEGIKNAAEGFEKEKKTKTEKKHQLKADDAAVAASNKKVNDLWDMLKNAGKDEMSASFVGLNSRQLEVLPKLVSAMAENAYLRIKRGMHNLEDVVKEMRKEFAPAAKIFKKEDVDAIYEQMMNIRYRDGEQRMSLKDWADYYEKTSPKHQENLVGDSKTAEERKLAEKKFIDVVNLQLGFKHKFNGIVELRKIAERVGLKGIKDTDLQELAETAIVKRARGIASSESTNDAVKFERIKTLYENQPSLNQRDSERVMKQQYSTPAPYAFLADMYVKGNGKVIESALEPSAGNGMLTIGLPMDKVHVNDIDAQRLANLRRQGFKNVTSQDGTQPFADKDVDVVVTNPPFGSATPKEYDGYKISSLEGQMAINALESMKDDGRAAIIIGGKTEYAKNGSLNPKDKAFLGYLYSHYNVEDVINVDGGLYAKQGTSYPTRIILINGRRNYDPEHKVFPPVEKEARAEAVKDYDELYKRIEDDILRSTEQPVDIRRKEKREGDKPSGRENVSDSTEENGGRGRLGTTTVHDGTSENSEPTELDPSTRPVGQSEDADGRPVEATGNGDSNTDGRGGQTSVPKSGPADGGSERGGNEPSGGNEPLRNGNGENGREPGVRHGSGHIQQPLENTPKEEKKQSLTTEKVKYQPHSAAYSIGAVVPARQKEALDNVLNKLGDADQYLVDNLGYNDKEDLYAHLAAEQIDAVALGLKQMEKGNGFIIGDQTGIGKGRQAAAIIRYAVKQGRIPISFTQKANLFSDTYRDLNDIGSPELRPFILASSNEGNIKVNYDEEVKGLDGQTTTVRKQKVVYKVPSKTETERVLKYIAGNGKLPEGYDYILTTYSQIRNGMEEFKGGKWKAKKKVTATDRNGQMKRDAIKRIAENSVFILDESHDAAGEGSGSAFIQDVLPKVKGVTFLSATYAKTPDAMKLYALKTDLGSKNKEEGEKGDASWKVLNAIKKGGAVFQEIMSQALTKSGQMIRRERDMTGVTIDWNPLTENEVEIQGQRDKFDNIFGIFNDILNFQRTYVDAKLGQMSDDLAFIQGSADHTPGTKDMGIGNVTFASKAYNVVQQALFSIKAEKVADYAIEAIKNGEKPVIAVNNTMGSMIDEYPMSVEMDMPDLNSTLMKGLEGILRYTEKNDMGDQVNSTLRVEELGEEAVARYNKIKQKIASVSSGLSISPIDVIKHRLEEAGYKVGELTGRNTEMVYTENGKVIRKNRTDKNKNALADRFNNGDLDALIINRSAAAGISLHASSKYKDQRQRTMIFAQMQGNINDEVQIRGRIDRTGQVRRGKYVYLVSAIPAEQRLMMMFKNKLKSLDANTTSSQKSKFNEVDVQDFTNKYGDEIVLQYMAQHPEYYNKLADPLGWGFMEYARDGLSIGELKSGMKPNITSPAYEVMKRLTLLPVKEQEVVLKDISDSYSQKIKQLNDMGMNDLEMTDMPLEAKTLKREVWKEGSDPNGDNAFADNTYIETVEMNVLRKPMKAEEVEEAQKKMLDGKDYETWRNDKVAEIRAAQQAKIEDTKSKMAEQTEKKVAKVEESTRLALEKENAKIQKKLDKGEELKPGEHILTEEEIKTRVNVAVDDVKRRLSEKLSDAIKNVNVKYDMFVNPLFIFDPNKTISVSNDWYLEELSTSLYPEFGRVIGFKYDKNYSVGSSSIIIATTDSRKRVEIPLNRQKVFERIQKDSEMFSKECKVVNMDTWDRMIPKKDRTTGRIITGNMLEALADNSSIGHLISYTTDDGKVKQGILVPDSVSTAEITGNMPIAKAYDWFTKKTSGTELVSTDGALRLTKNFGSMYTLFVPASRKEGGKYYLNQDLLDLVHGRNFQSKGKNFWATFDAEKLKDVLNVLNGMGVEVKTPNDYSESGTHFREDRGLQYSKTDTKDVKKGRIIPEDVDKTVSSQIEKRFDAEVERLYGSISDRPNVKRYAELMANKFAGTQYVDTFDMDREGNKTKKYDGLKSIIDSLDNKLKDIEKKYGIKQRDNIWDIERRVKEGKSLSEATEGNDSRGMDGASKGDSGRISRKLAGTGKDEGKVGRNGTGNSTSESSLRMLEALDEYKRVAMDKAAAERAREYLIERFNDFRHKYGLKEGDWASQDLAERIFNDNNSDKEVQKIFERIRGLVEVLGTKLKHGVDIRKNVTGHYNHPENFILIDTDYLSAIGFKKQTLASTICHEMLHVVTSDIINLYRKGYGDLLNDSQRKAAKEVVDLYDKINSYFERHFKGTKPYALTNPAEMITELANPTWRRIAAQIPFAKGWFRKIVAAIRNMLGFPPKVSALDRLDKALENVIRNLDYGVFQKGAELNNKIVNSKASIPVSSHITQLSEKTGGKVNFVSSVDEITNKAAKAAIEEGRKITGWYDEKTGEVHLYMPNIHDRYTAEKTIWHEVVGHKGMRELFGDERFDKFLREVWYDLDKPENAALKKLVDEERKYNPLNIYDAIEEGIARLAEDGKGEAGFWNGIKNKVSDFLHEIGYRIAPNTKDVKYLLWLSKNLQKNPNDPYWKMRAEAVKYRLDHERMPAVVAHDGMFYGNDGKVRSMENLTKSEWDEATDGQIHFRTTPSAGTALDRYHRSLDEHGYMFTESYMDNMLSLKKLMNAIVPDKKIEDIASSENPYMLQNTMQGAMSDAAQMFERNVMKPLDKAMADVLDAFDGKKDDEKIRNFNLYMITKHGLERNREFFVRDFLKQMRMDEQKKQDADFLENSYYSDKEYLDNELKAGNIDLKEYYRQLDESIRNHFDADFEAGEHDYSGMHAIQEVAKSSDPYDDAEAIQSVMDSEAKMESIKKGSVKDYWDKVKAATQYSIDSDYKNGIISKELHGHVSNMFNWYVPLRKYDEATAEDTYGYITEQGDPKSYIGSTIMRARGHKYLSETNVLAQIGAMGNRAIKNGGMNAIRQAFARFARNNSGNNLITETSVWYEKDPVVNIVYERYPDIPEDATADEINQIVSDFNKDMKMKESQGMAYKVYRRDKIGYKFQRAENKSQHIVDVKIAGRTHTFIINGNPRAAQALNGLLEHKNDTLAGRVTASISRKMAQLCTSYNPEFVMRNMIKDFEFASTNLLAKEGLVYTKRFEQYYAKVGIIEGIRNSKLKDFGDTGGFGLYAKYRNGTLDTNNKLHRYFKEFMENGGETGWVQIKNMKDFTKEYKVHVKTERNKVQKVGMGIYDAIFTNLENINEIAENLARFATYCASRDSNRSVIRSVYDAKEVSTNFNRHGSGNAIYYFKNGEMGTGKTARKNIYGFTAAWFRNGSMFFNAGIQSTNLLIKNFKNNKAGTIGYIASVPFISGMAMALLNNFIISNEDEKDRKGVKDPYAELPDYIRRNNLCIYIGGGEFVTIPLAIEERAFYGLGDFAAGMTFSKNISSQKMPNLTENKDIDKYLNPFMDAVGCMSQLVPVADYLGNASFGKHPVQETIKAVAPSATSPFLEWVYNSDWKGAPIQRDNKFDENQPSWMLAYKGTPEWMINMNKKVNALTNDVAPGNEDMKGNDFLDEVTNPSALHHFYGSYFGGAATFVERVGGLIKNGKDTETKDIPFLRSLLYTPNEQSSLQRTKSKWYNYKDEMEKTMANVDRLKSKNVPIDKRITNIGEYYQFQNSKEAAKVRVIELAEKQMKRWKKMRDKASDTESINFANQNIDRIMMDAVDELDRLN